MRKSGRGRHVLVTQQLLYGPDVVARLDQVRRKRMAQGVRAQRLVDAGALACRFHRTGENGVIEVMAADHAIQRIDGAPHRRKHELPAELARGVRILARQRMRQVRG